MLLIHSLHGARKSWKQQDISTLLSTLRKSKVLTWADVLPHDLYIFIPVTSRMFMQKSQGMVQFMLNDSFPHASSFHHRNSLSTSHFSIVGPAAERGIEHQQKTYGIFVVRQRDITENLVSLTCCGNEMITSCPLG